jgi:predicted O-methyltransferase YrrM
MSEQLPLKQFQASCRRKNFTPKRRDEFVKWPFLDQEQIPKEFVRLDPWEAEYVYMIAKQSKTAIVEIGRYHGGSTILLAGSNDSVKVHSIDIDPVDDQRLQSIIDDLNFDNIKLIVGDSTSPSNVIPYFDVLFIDGVHSSLIFLHRQRLR